jgi:uncharacterized protein (TIGR03435 family)
MLRRIAVAIPALLGIWGTFGAWAQSRADAALAFEVASVKPNNSADFRGVGYDFLPGGKFTATDLSLYWLIALAYDIAPQSVRLSGGPAWIRTERYDVQAEAGAGVIPVSMSRKAREDKMRLMLQALLVDRFKLTMRHENKEMPVYAVLVGKGGSKLQKSTVAEQDCPSSHSFNELSCHVITGGMGRGMHGKAVSIADMVQFVENWSDRPVIDKTGIDGLFAVDTDGWAPMRPRFVLPGRDPRPEDIAMADPTRPTLSLIFERLGLKMESQRAAVDSFVIEQIERPSEN